MKRFTFKTEKPTGRYKSFDTPYHMIKLNGNIVGDIQHTEPHIITLMVTKADINEDGNPNCPFKNVRLKQRSTSLDEAKKYLNDNFAAIIALNIFVRS